VEPRVDITWPVGGVALLTLDSGPRNFHDVDAGGYASSGWHGIVTTVRASGTSGPSR
jgi:hypothetical protein